MIEKEFIFFKGVNVKEIFSREKDSLLRIEGCHIYISSFVKAQGFELKADAWRLYRDWGWM